MSDIENVKKLREVTGAGFKDCNLAIKESNGDIDKAIEILRVKGISKASKKNVSRCKRRCDSCCEKENVPRTGNSYGSFRIMGLQPYWKIRI